MGIGSQRPPGVVAPLGCASPPGVLWAPRNPNEYVSIPISIATYSERAAWCEVCDVIIHVLRPRASSPPPTPPRPPMPAPPFHDAKQFMVGRFGDWASHG